MARASGQAPAHETLADRLHSASIHLLRRLRAEDRAAGLSAPRLSALSVVVFAGPLPMSRLAEAERVRPPTMTRLVTELERAGLVRRDPDPADRRILLVSATGAGREALGAARRRRTAALAEDVARLAPEERQKLTDAVPLLERLGAVGLPDDAVLESSRRARRVPRGARRPPLPLAAADLGSNRVARPTSPG